MKLLYDDVILFVIKLYGIIISNYMILCDILMNELLTCVLLTFIS